MRHRKKHKHDIVEDPRFLHGVCGYHDGGPACEEPATWHYLVAYRGRTRELYACDAHHPVALPYTTDHHRLEPPCPKPTSQWVPRTPGTSFCQDPGETTAHHELILELTRPALQPA